MAATALQVKKYFGFEDAKKFMEEWKQLTDADKAELQELLAKEIEAKRWEG